LPNPEATIYLSRYQDTRDNINKEMHAIIFSKKRRALMLQLSLHGRRLVYVDNVKYLGVTLDERLRLKFRIRMENGTRQTSQDIPF
jgi:hypothetical protein